MKFWKCFSYLIYFSTFTALLKETVGFPPVGKSCKTPLDAKGKCIILSSCKSLLKILRQQPVPPESLRFLQRSTCDYESSEPKVCCADSELEERPVTQKPTQAQTTPATSTTPTSRKPVTPSPIPTTTQQPKVTPQSGGSNTLQKILTHRNLHLLPNSSQCGTTLLSDRITGGSDAGLGSYPWMALIGFPFDDGPIQFGCGGTLINARYILTAAHCVTKLPDGLKPIVVRIGEYNQKTDPDCEEICAPKYQDLDIEEISFHEKYDLEGIKENDIAIIRMKGDAVLGTFVTPICLPHGERLQKLQGSQDPIVAGWGRTTSGNPESADILQMVSVPFVTSSKCNLVYRDNLGGDIDEGRFCAGGIKGKDSCQGDSGGPLMLALHAKSVNGRIRVFQFGITSLGPKTCEKAGLPALYTKVSHFMPWILDHLRP